MTQTRPIKVTNTLTGKKEVLETISPGKLTMYSCGPTVYGFIHIGNLRTALVADMFYRYFRRAGYDVNYVRNFTDVDDKIIKKANEEGVTAEDIARKYMTEVEKDYAAAGMLDPTHKPTVTTHIPEIISLIDRIVASGKAYAVDGEVLFAIDRFPGYGKLSHKNIEELVAGIRVDVSEKKRNPLDFALWKPAKPGEPFWDSPWGKGRPGWHIECSAMSSRWLGDQIDVHHGGEDLIFPHHENEVAQSEAASGRHPFVKYWLHSAFLTMSKEKMSKSLGNVFLARDFLQQFGGEFARYLLLSVHYRSMIDFNDDSIDQALVGLHRMYEAKSKAVELAGTPPADRASALKVPAGAGEPWTSFVAECEVCRREIDEHFANDFNSAAAIASLFSLIRSFNRITAGAHDLATPAASVAARHLIEIMDGDLAGVLGVGASDPRKALADIERIRAARPAAAGGEKPTEDEIRRAIEARANARKTKNFSEADRIRKDLESRGVIIKDGPAGTAWSYK